jgi:hypothetical protein
MSNYADSEKQKELIRAINVLAQHAEDRLPPGYEIQLQFNRVDCSIYLLDENADDIDLLTPDIGISVFDDACEAALQDYEEQLRLCEEEDCNDEYAKFRDFHCGDTLDLRMKELAKEFALNISWDKLLELNI